MELLAIAIGNGRVDFEFWTVDVADGTPEGAGEEEANAVGSQELVCQGYTAIGTTLALQEEQTGVSVRGSVPMARPLYQSVFEDLEDSRSNIVLSVEPWNGYISVERGLPLEAAVG